MNVRELFLRKTLPVFVNSYNQYTYLKELIQSLLGNYFFNVWVIDNKSSYPPLLDYYKTASTKHEGKVNILFYNANRGPHYFHFSDLYRQLWNNPHFYTDPDLIFDSFDSDFAQKFVDTSERFKVAKIGAALTIPDSDEMVDTLRAMPETNNIPVSVREWESRFWKNEIEPGIFQAPIDTTFHYFNPNYYIQSAFYTGLRLAGSGFQARHRPWFKSDQIPDDEKEFYLKTRDGHGGWVS